MDCAFVETECEGMWDWQKFKERIAIGWPVHIMYKFRVPDSPGAIVA